MPQKNWRDQWDDHATEESEKFMKMPVAELLAQFRAGKLGEYYVIWKAIGERAKLQDIGWELYDFLNSYREYLPRYHCAGALLKLMNSTAFTQVELSGKQAPVAANLKKLKAMLEEKIGPRK